MNHELLKLTNKGGQLKISEIEKARQSRNCHDRCVWFRVMEKGLVLKPRSIEARKSFQCPLLNNEEMSN